MLHRKAQLEYKIKVWGFRKKVPKNKSQAVWQYIGHQVAKRERLGKRTEVVLEKEVLDVAKVRKETGRHQATSWTQYNPGVKSRLLVCATGWNKGQALTCP